MNQTLDRCWDVANILPRRGLTMLPARCSTPIPPGAGDAVPGLSGVPPGRAGRNWVRRSLATAERGREQIDRKLRILLPEQQRLRIQAGRHRADWLSACAEASTWLERAALLGGQDGIRGASTLQPAGVEVQWTTSMGCATPPAPGRARPG